jgi:hypothetical protein
MDAYGRCTNLGMKILPIVLPSTVEVENVLVHPPIHYSILVQWTVYVLSEVRLQFYNVAACGSPSFRAPSGLRPLVADFCPGRVGFFSERVL